MRPTLVAVTLAAAAMFGCSSAEPSAGDAGLDAAAIPDAPSTIDAGADVTPPPPFHGDGAAATSPVLAGTYLFDPADPHPGDTITVLVKSAKFKQANAPKMTLDATSASGTATQDVTIMAGGSGVIYYYAVPDVPLGDVCLLTHVNGAPELAGKITVTPRPAPAPSPQGVYKVATNHQFTCQEQVPWGNEFHVAVLDAQGKGVPGAVVKVRLPDTTDLATIKNADTKPVPNTLTMDSSGHYDDYFWWPSNDNGFTVFELSVQGAASDTATEISSGWWETDDTGCRYCDPSQPINVYGHWSHRIVFQLDPTATQACVVPSDHAGMSACPSHGHAHHAPSHEACWQVR
jgi:hypothetical protein